ncbi:hypothetical protein AVEN_153717-1 [Araneus ventricosus]|uniref:Uncharacterized protein n=1 Tax=Araneus ventricosus TaxID=182803 RepID=A0A4Y2PQ15_ARAVE|nr:hypothetical protein AVEN_153717-1 [Araneus ventricosus]
MQFHYQTCGSVCDVKSNQSEVCQSVDLAIRLVTQNRIKLYKWNLVCILDTKIRYVSNFGPNRSKGIDPKCTFNSLHYTKTLNTEKRHTLYLEEGLRGEHSQGRRDDFFNNSI